MKSPLFSSAEQFKSKVLYYPEKRPGYCGWASFFPFGDDAFGLAFNEVCCASGDSASARITLEDYEAAAMPYSYQDITYPFATGKYTNETVYMLSEDRGQSWRQTARVPARTRHYWHVGFGDRSMVRIYSLSPADGEPFGVFSEVSADLGKTWTKTACLMDGYFVFIHKLKKLSNGWIIACGPVFESFGPGYTRRGRHDVSEDVIENIQTCFFCSKDRGLTWSQPHYVLPGIQAREPDFVDLGDGSILFVNSDVYAARSVRQVVRNTRFGYVNEPLRAIFYGAESVNGSLDGYVPETVAQMENGLLIGARRHAPYAVSNDMGENWHRIDAPDCEYQPSLEVMPDGEVVTVWHHGGDSPFGQRDMHIGLHRFYLKEDLPKPIKLRAERMLSPDGSYFDNRFLFALTSADKPLAGQTLTVRYQWAWNEDGTYNTKPLSEFASEITVVTDGNGEAVADLTFLEKTADIFKGYSVDCVYAGGCAETRSDCLYCYVMSPKRGVGDRYPFYLMNGVLVLSPAAAKEFPFIKKAFRDLPCENGVFTEEAWLLACRSAPGAVRALEALRNAHIVEEAPGGYRCCRSTHQTSDCIRECRVSGNRVVLT